MTLNTDALQGETPALAKHAEGQAPTVLLSVFDKTGVVELAKSLSKQFSARLVATGGTASLLREAGLAVTDVADVTGVGELLGGRVKTLHPAIFGGLLASDNTGRTPQAADLGLPFYVDIAVINLYPFEATLQQQTKAGELDAAELVEKIDIGGVALLRAAAKNHAHVFVLSQPCQYEPFITGLSENRVLTDTPQALAYRRTLAKQAFEQTAYYDALIAATFETLEKHDALEAAESPEQTAQTAQAEPVLPEALPEILTLPLKQIQPMRYGENPHQDAALYSAYGTKPSFSVLQGKALSYNNLLDLYSAWHLINEFDFAEPACAIIKHNNPCGVAIDSGSQPSIKQAFMRALACDPVSAFGGIIACNQPVDADAAQAMTQLFLEVIAAPGYTPEALALFESKKNLRVVTLPLTHTPAKTAPLMLRQLNAGLFLAQRTNPGKGANFNNVDSASQNIFQQWQQQLTTPTQAKPTPEQLQDLFFAWQVAKHLKSNAMVLTKNGQTVGLGGGQTSRIGALEIALRQACDQSIGAVLASDGFLPAVDNIEAAAQAKISAIAQPGGSIKDAEVIALADKLGVAMVMTGIREFKH
ncbi:MAG: bifunctional phosphoribosylaminoimidazolecarboxamide formyltransferase/IMP cyclohydrolase [Vampirovibrionales bacterium]|nr:bifunctional phosphoribosylaminoimidazolecarboxamide formyltransferase/IMP cyclohydrolase [Vampirovibrionales bacterium]